MIIGIGIIFVAALYLFIGYRLGYADAKRGSQ